MTPTDIRFAADGMLQSLATWLRALGYDCLAGRDLFGLLLLEQAVVDGTVSCPAAVRHRFRNSGRRTS
ncbi:MAG: Mut7-C RNAse domain-containing protein [Verrucomicrobiia bacterium]